MILISSTFLPSSLPVMNIPKLNISTRRPPLPKRAGSKEKERNMVLQLLDLWRLNCEAHEDWQQQSEVEIETDEAVQWELTSNHPHPFSVPIFFQISLPISFLSRTPQFLSSNFDLCCPVLRSASLFRHRSHSIEVNTSEYLWFSRLELVSNLLIVLFPPCSSFQSISKFQFTPWPRGIRGKVWIVLEQARRTLSNASLGLHRERVKRSCPSSCLLERVGRFFGIDRVWNLSVQATRLLTKITIEAKTQTRTAWATRLFDEIEFISWSTYERFWWPLSLNCCSLWILFFSQLPPPCPSSEPFL